MQEKAGYETFIFHKLTS